MKERLSAWAQRLCSHEPFLTTDVAIADDVVRYELVRDRVEFNDPGYLPPSHPDYAYRYSEIETKVIYLTQRFGKDRVKAALKRPPKPRQPGHPKIWYQIRLITLGFIVQNTAKLFDTSVDGACREIQRMGGIFEIIDADRKVRSQVASTRGHIRHLCYKAERSFDDFETNIRRKYVGDKAASFKEEIRLLADELGGRNVFVMPILSLAMLLVCQRMSLEGICQNPPAEIPIPSENSVDISRVKFVPDGNGCWVVYPPGVFN